MSVFGGVAYTVCGAPFALTVLLGRQEGLPVCLVTKGTLIRLECNSRINTVNEVDYSLKGSVHWGWAEIVLTE